MKTMPRTVAAAALCAALCAAGGAFAFVPLAAPALHQQQSASHARLALSRSAGTSLVSLHASGGRSPEGMAARRLVSTLRNQRDTALAELAQAKDEALQNQAEKEEALARLEAATLKLREYRALIDEFDLGVSKAIGGPQRRTKAQMRDEVIEALSAMPVEDFEDYVDSVELGSEREFAQVKDGVREALAVQLARLRDWVAAEEAKRILLEDIAKEL